MTTPTCILANINSIFWFGDRVKSLRTLCITLWDLNDETLKTLTRLRSSQITSFSRVVSSVSSCGSSLLIILGYFAGSWWMMGEERVKHKSLVAHRKVSLNEREKIYSIFLHVFSVYIHVVQCVCIKKIFPPYPWQDSKAA